MMDLNTAMNVAINTASGTPPYYLACNICQLRGLDPHGQAMSMPLMNWQATMVEQMLAATMTDMLLDPRAVRP
jgi:hypothetical protein